MTANHANLFPKIVRYINLELFAIPKYIDIWPNDGYFMSITDNMAELEKILKISGIF